jgi:hypothetical protein
MLIFYPGFTPRRLGFLWRYWRFGPPSTKHCARTASTYLLTKVQAGITHCFVNLGSDHPSIIEAIVKGQNEKKGNFPRIITCPNEVMLAPCLILFSGVKFADQGASITRRWSLCLWLMALLG